jgi:hypothetical protein
LPISGLSLTSAAFSPSSRVIRVHSSVACAVKIGGSAPVAKSGLGGCSRLAAGVSEFYAVHPGDSAAVITTT